MLRKSNIEGYNIPGIAEKVITSLFADDTTVYMRKSDDWADLHGLLTKWCKASKAKFNIDKTKILPIGSPEYRQEVIRTRKISPTQDPIPDKIEFVPDGTGERSLGCIIGNGIDEDAQWAPTQSKVDDGLERWRALYPTLNGKRLIANYIAAGCTQYRAKVQEIPKNVEKQLIKRLRTFVWDSDATPPLALQKLYDPIEEGGIKLVDLEARTEAILLTWLQSFLNLGPERP
ncbi:hypothetical protein K525DRAFT_214314, partial [Schizophyllum commune Loenen D]